ncbi:MAG: DNA-binding protein Alba [Candidatus Gastranaerophilales bacterium]|jgi:DNA-binding protein|nr:DNA-binding protein Alba [Candidatus Gastranaerophilales bacterium]
MTESIDKDSNVVYIGDKPFMNYVTSVVMQFVTKKRDEVVIKARGRFITRAVDVAETAKIRFLNNVKVKVSNVEIGSEEFENKEGKKVNVSIIEITLKKE